jgi:hypothetical protein
MYIQNAVSIRLDGTTTRPSEQPGPIPNAVSRFVGERD